MLKVMIVMTFDPVNGTRCCSYEKAFTGQYPNAMDKEKGFNVEKKVGGLQVAVLKGRVRGCIMCNQSSVGNVRLFSTRILFLLLLLFSLTHTLSFFPSLLGSVTTTMALFIGRIPKTMSTVCQQLHASIRLN